MQAEAIRTVANPLHQNKAILLNHLISNSYIPHTDLRKNLKNAYTFFFYPVFFVI